MVRSILLAGGRLAPLGDVSNQDGSRVASRWRVTGRNEGLMGTRPNGVPFEMTGTAVWEVDADGRLRHNWVGRNAHELYGLITGGTVDTMCSEVPTN